MPELPDVAPAEFIEADTTNVGQRRMVQRYTDAADRTTLNPTPEQGDMSLLLDTNRIDFFTGAEWVTVPGAIISGVQTLTLDAPATNSIELGRIDGVASTPFIDFHAGVVEVDRDVRIIASDGTGVSDEGKLTVAAEGGVTLESEITQVGADIMRFIMFKGTSVVSYWQFTIGGAGQLVLQHSPTGTGYTTVETWNVP